MTPQEALADALTSAQATVTKLQAVTLPDVTALEAALDQAIAERQQAQTLLDAQNTRVAELELDLTAANAKLTATRAGLDALIGAIDAP